MNSTAYKCDKMMDIIGYLIKKNSDINACSPSGETLLYKSLILQRAPYAKLAIFSGADISMVDKFGNSALHIIACLCDTTLLEAVSISPFFTKVKV